MRPASVLPEPAGFCLALPLRLSLSVACDLEDFVKQMIVLTMVGIFVGTASLGADHERKPNKDKDGSHPVTSGGRSTVAVSVSWGRHDIEIVRRHYAPTYRNLPPGLQKKYARTGKLPPGWQKKMQPLPAPLERDCAPLPVGYRRGVIDAHAVIYNSGGAIVDVVALF